mmetsp:Transcript_129860/g.252999  ORF Transcript_129860/g.252999 Transcript_129860/m.252999 type:complete len:459 (+) Transcript_129860:63-1439(+)
MPATAAPPSAWKKPPTIKSVSGIKPAGLSAFGRNAGAYVGDIKAESKLAAAGEDSESLNLDVENLEAMESMPMGELVGIIKSWNSAKGFGFITSDQVDGDVFFSKSELPPEAREVHGSILEGREVNLDSRTGPDGRARATMVQIVATEGKPLLGVIKSYSDRHRYGFITSSALTEDARFQATDLPPGLSLMGTNLKGHFVTFDVQQLPDGKVRVKTMQLQGQSGANVNPVTADPPTFSAAAFPRPPARIQPWSPHPRPPAMPPPPAGVPPSAGSMLKGTVKSYSDRHGYGFINAPGQVVDIKFAKQDLLSPSIAAGTLVSFVPITTPDGRMQARQVSMAGGMKRCISPADGFHSFDRPKKQQRIGGGMSWASAAAATQQQLPAEMPADGERLAGVVRSYIPSSGFGFITCDEVPGDIYFGRSMMPPDMHSMELSGRMVTFELAYASDGKLRGRDVALA